MPVVQQSQASHHDHHTPSRLSSIFHAFHSSHHPSASSHRSLSAEQAQLFDAFESNLCQRLTLLLPLEGISLVSLASLGQAMDVLLSTEADLRVLIPGRQHPISEAQSRMMNEFFERSVKLLDVCNAIKEQISEVQAWQVLLEVVLDSLAAKQGNLTKGQIRRSSKALVELRFLMEAEMHEEVESIHLRRSFRSIHNLQHGESAHDPQRWRSCPWNGNISSAFSTPLRQLHAVGTGLTPPKISDGDVKENICAAIYALNVVSVFFLSTIMAAFPSAGGKGYIISLSPARSFSWAAPLQLLQDKVQDEMRRKGKKVVNGNLWELDQVLTIIQRLSEVTEGALSSEEFPLPDSSQEIVRNLVKQLRPYVEELDRDLKPLHDQITALYNRLITARLDMLDILSSSEIAIQFG